MTCQIGSEQILIADVAVAISIDGTAPSTSREAHRLSIVPQRSGERGVLEICIDVCSLYLVKIVVAQLLVEVLSNSRRLNLVETNEKGAAGSIAKGESVVIHYRISSLSRRTTRIIVSVH